MFRSVVITLFIALLCACGGGSTNYSSGGGSGGGTGSADAEGLWSGTYTISGNSSSNVIYAAIAQGGYAFFYDQNGIIYVLPQFTGSGTLTGTLTAYAPAGTTFTSGLTKETFAVTATVSSASITGTFTGNGATGNFTLTPYAPFNGNPSIVSGTWHGFYVGTGSSAALALTVQKAGTFVGTDSNGCTLSGTLTQVQANGSPINLFNASVDATGSGCLGQLNGLAFESNADVSGLFGGTTGTYYYVGVSSASGAFVAELKVQ